MKADMVYHNSTMPELSDSLATIAQALGFLLALHPQHKMNQLKLVQLLWAADRLHLRQYGGTITESAYWATVNGPISTVALAVVEQNGHILTANEITSLQQSFTSDGTNISLCNRVDNDCLSDTAMEMLTKAYRLFGAKSVAELGQISRRYPEWSKFKAPFASGERTPQPIDKLDFFKNPRHSDKYFAMDSNILSDAKMIYLEDCELLAAVNNLDGA